MSPESASTAPVALVTGAAGGIGQALVRRLLSGGFRLCASDLALADLPCTMPATLHTVPADLTNEQAVAGLVMTALQQFGRIDCVVHLAGAVGRGPLEELSLEEWQRLLDINLTSAFLLARECAAALAASRGTLVLVSSINGRNGGSALSGPAYAAAKAGVINLTRYLAREWAPRAVRVNCIAPGPVDTPMLARLDAQTRMRLSETVPLGRIAGPEEIAGVIAFLCSKDASCMTGAVLNASGGLVLD